MIASLKTALLCVASSAFAASSTVRDLQHELRLDDSGWRLTNESDSSLSWIGESGVAVTLTVQPGFRAGFPKPTDLPALRDAYRREALSYGGGLVEAEPRTVGGISFNLVTMKFPLGLFQSPPDSRPGFAYQINAVIPTSEARYVLQVAAAESGPTEIRESTGIIIFMKQAGITDLAAAAKAFRRDPYEQRYDDGALFNVCDERRFDSSLPDHPLSRCRAYMDRLLNSLTISDRIRRIAQFRATEPSK